MNRGLLVLGAMGALALACNREPLEVASNVDLAQFQGKWYEIAHLPRPTQANCTATTATYTMQSDGQLTFVHECTLTDGSYHGATALAHVVDAKTPAKMQVDFGGVMGDYWITEVAPDYRYAVVGHPSRDYLWILSRTPEMDAKDLSAVIDHAHAENFDTTKLEYTPQGPDPKGTPAPATTYGCAMNSGANSSYYGFAVGFAVIGLLLARRKRSAV